MNPVPRSTSLLRAGAAAIGCLLLAAPPGFATCAPQPYVFKDITPGPDSTYVIAVWRLGDLALFRTETKQGSTLWRTDGTESGTFAIAPDPRRRAARLADSLWYLGPGGLWKTDGSATGTALAVPLDVRFNEEIGALDDALLFSVESTELWRSDGTPEGTAQIASLPKAGGSSFIKGFTRAGRFLYFINESFTGANEVWRTDGTTDGTVQLASGLGPNDMGTYALTAVGDLLFFVAELFDDADDIDLLWRTDGTPEGTFSLKRLGLSGLPVAAFGTPPRAWFGAWESPDNPCSGSSLWKSDGTPEGTVKAVQAPEWTCPPNPAHLTVSGDRLYFEASCSAKRGLWKTDGTNAGTTLVHDTGGKQIWNLTDVEGTLYLDMSDPEHGLEPWRSDGTPEGTFALGDVWPGTTGGGATWFTRVGGKVLFYASDPANGGELRAWDVAPASSALLRDDSLGSLERDGMSLPLPLDRQSDLYRDSFLCWDEDPDADVVQDARRPLVFWAVDGPDRIQLVRTPAGTVRIRF